MAQRGRPRKEKKEFVIPSNPKERQAIHDAVKEMVDHMLAISSYREKIGEIRLMLKEDYGMPPKDANKLAKTVFKGEFSKLMANVEEFESLYLAIIGDKE